MSETSKQPTKQLAHYDFKIFTQTERGHEPLISETSVWLLSDHPELGYLWSGSSNPSDPKSTSLYIINEFYKNGSISTFNCNTKLNDAGEPFVITIDDITGDLVLEGLSGITKFSGETFQLRKRVDRMITPVG